MSYSHYKVLFCETPRRLYYVSTQGVVTSQSKTSKEETILVASYTKRGVARINIPLTIKGETVVKQWTLKRLVYQAVNGSLKESETVQCLDGDETNCSITNLILISKKEAGMLNGAASRSRAVIIQERGELPRRYPSVREAAKELYVSYQSLINYLGGAGPKRSILTKKGRKIFYADTVKK